MVGTRFIILSVFAVCLIGGAVSWFFTRHAADVIQVQKTTAFIAAALASIVVIAALLVAVFARKVARETTISADQLTCAVEAKEKALREASAMLLEANMK